MTQKISEGMSATQKSFIPKHTLELEFAKRDLNMKDTNQELKIKSFHRS